MKGILLFYHFKVMFSVPVILTSEVTVVLLLFFLKKNRSVIFFSKLILELAVKELLEYWV